MARRLRTFWLAIGLLTTQCVPEPKSTPCRNDSDCPDGERGRAYCVRRHCVECITRASCGAHMTCVKGECVPG
jgi:hypothetical protein